MDLANKMCFHAPPPLLFPVTLRGIQVLVLPSDSAMTWTHLLTSLKFTSIKCRLLIFLTSFYFKSKIKIKTSVRCSI